jgi:hypothetical protein
VTASLNRALRLSSFVICLIVAVSFLLFVVNQTNTASNHQQEIVSGNAAPGSATTTKPSHIGSVHKTIDEASNTLTSPFSGVTAGSTSQWAIRGVNLLFALVVYGFGLGFLARLITVKT